MRKLDNLTPFLAGVGIGVAGSLLLAPEAAGKTLNRMRELAAGAGDRLKRRGEAVHDAATVILGG